MVFEDAHETQNHFQIDTDMMHRINVQDANVGLEPSKKSAFKRSELKPVN